MMRIVGKVGSRGGCAARERWASASSTVRFSEWVKVPPAAGAAL